MSIPEAWTLVGRAVTASVGVVTLLAFLGLTPAWVLCRGSLRPHRLVLAPLLGWLVLTGANYFLLIALPFSSALTGLVGCAAVANGALMACVLVRRLTGRSRGSNNPRLRVHALSPAGRRRWRFRWAVAPALVLVSLLVFMLHLLPHLHHGALALLVPNQDDGFFVELVDGLWAAPAGVHYGAQITRVETGWAYHQLLALYRLFPQLDDLEAVPVAAYLATALSVAPTALFFSRGLGLPWRWAVAGSLLAGTHGLVLWVPGYGFGPNSAAIAAAPLAFLGVTRAWRLRSVRVVIFGGLSLGLLLMSYTKVTALLFGFTAVGLGLALLLDALDVRFIPWLQHGAPDTGGGRARQRWRRWRGWRLASAWLLGVVAGGYALYDCALWALPNASGLLFDTADTAGAGWNWRAFPGFGVWLGVDTWSLIALPAPTPLQALWPGLRLIGVVAGVVLLLTGLWSLRHPPHRPIMGVLVGVALFYLYARLLKAFPYAVFKVQTFTAFVLVGVCLRGALVICRGPVERATVRTIRWSGWLVRRLSPALPALGGVGLLCYGLVAGAASWQTLRFFWQPWGPLMTPTLLQEAATVAAAVPRGDTVLISGSARLMVPPEDAAARPHPIAFHSVWQAEQYGTARLWGVVVHHLRQAGVPYLGVFERAVAPVVAPPEDTRQYQYVLLGDEESPEAFGTGPEWQVWRGTALALYRHPAAALLDARSVEHLLTETDIAGPARLAVSCEHQISAPDTLPASRPVGALCGQAAVRLGLLASRPGPVNIVVTEPGGTTRFPLYLANGLSWYTTPGMDLPATVTVTPTGGRLLYVAGGAVLPESGAMHDDEPHLQPPSGGAVLASLQATDEGVRLAVRYGEATGAMQRLRVALVLASPHATMSYATDADPQQPFQLWQWRLRPGEMIEQQIGTRLIPLGGAPRWVPADDRYLVRLRFERNSVAWYEVPIGIIEVRNGAVTEVKTITPLAALSAPDPASPIPPLPEAGTLVKGSADGVFLVQEHALRWIPDLETFSRYGFAWEQVQPMADQILVQWPIGLPLS